jgi:hypothetical protein
MGAWVSRRDSLGNSYEVWEPSVMARIPDEFLRCAFFLYPSRKEADEGSPSGGTGFFVGVDWTNNTNRRHVYAVTNRHNITACRDSVVIRATKLDGMLETIEIDPVEWHPSGSHDINYAFQGRLVSKCL